MKLTKKLLKKIDRYRQPVFTFSPHRDKNTNEKENTIYHGTVVGGALTLICLVTIIYYTVTELRIMGSGRYDNFNLQVKTNPLTTGLSEIYINETSFFPTLEI